MILVLLESREVSIGELLEFVGYLFISYRFIGRFCFIIIKVMIDRRRYWMMVFFFLSGFIKMDIFKIDR